MTDIKIVLRPTFARRMPDPVFQTNPIIHHHIFWVPAHTLVDDLSYGPNARKPNTRKHIYRRVDESLQNIDCLEDTFHLKNLGISINASIWRHSAINVSSCGRIMRKAHQNRARSTRSSHPSMTSRSPSLAARR